MKNDTIIFAMNKKVFFSIWKLIMWIFNATYICFKTCEEIHDDNKNNE